MQEIRLNEYQAQIQGQQLRLGTWDSYGIEQLQILPGTGWEGLTITATFVTPQGATRVLVPQDGLLSVPPEATARALPIGTKGQIVFAGVADGVQRISTNVLYIVTDHAPVEGADSHPTPGEFAQFVAQVKQDADGAAQSAAQAEASARLAQQGADKGGWFSVAGVDGILYFLRSDNAPDDLTLRDNGKGILEVVYGEND